MCSSDLSWKHQPHIALAPDGRMIGYLVTNGSGDSVCELCAVSEGHPELEIARAWVAQQSSSSTRFDLSPWHPLVHKLGPIGESFSTSSTGNWQVFDWTATLSALLAVRASTGPLVDGRVVVEISGRGTLALEVQSGETTCTRTEEIGRAHV